MTPPTMADEASLNRGAFRQVVAFYVSEPGYVLERLAAASSWVEDECERRFMPFVGLVETFTAHGVRPDSGGARLPGLTGTAGLAVPSAAGAGMVRDFWVSEKAPHRPELWAYTGITVDLLWPWASSPVRVPPAAVVGPAPDTGHVQLGAGVHCPPGTQVTITYGGGYNTAGQGYPPALVEAVRTEAVRQLIVELDPQIAPELSAKVLEADTDRKLCHWRRYRKPPVGRGGGGRS